MAKKNGKKTVLVIIAGSVFLLIALALIISFAFLMFSPDMPVFSPVVAHIEIKGEISSEELLFESNKSVFDIVKELDLAQNDPTVSAVLLEINSPGGTPVATRQLTEKILLVREKKPVVAWISDVGASAGYYAAASTDLVIADEDSLTGSIGTISIIPDYSGLFEEFGIGMRVFKSGEMKDIGSPFREITGEEEELLQKMVEQATAGFKKKVIEYRGERLDAEKFEEIADGRILTGRQALEAGLVDELGTRAYALKRAGELANVESPVLKSYAVERLSIADLFSSAGYSLGTGFREGLSSTKLSIKS